MNIMIYKYRYLLFLAGFFLLTCKSKEKQESTIPPSRVNIYKVEHRTMKFPVRVNGMIMPSEQIKLSFKTGGLISKILVEEGDKVRKGELMAELNLSEIGAQ